MSSNKLVKLLHLVGWFIWIVWWCTDLPTSNHEVTYLIVPAVLSFEFISKVLWKHARYQDIFSKWILTPNGLRLLYNFLITEPTRSTNFSNLFYFGMKLHMFRTVPLSIIRSFPLYTQQWYMSYRFADNLRAGSGWNMEFHSDPTPLLWKTPDDGQRNCPKHVEFHSKIKF
jgi:hypothetical protein